MKEDDHIKNIFISGMEFTVNLQFMVEELYDFFYFLKKQIFLHRGLII